jgi:hypothetical protein
MYSMENIKQIIKKFTETGKYMNKELNQEKIKINLIHKHIQGFLKKKPI